MNKRDFNEFITKAKGLKAKQVMEALEQLEVPYKFFQMEGTAKEETESVPKELGRYDTVSNGMGSYYAECIKRVGETLMYDNQEWIVAYNGIRNGSAHVFDMQRVIIVRSNTLL